ncbi:MAG: thioredoxin domain-containing protein, partial [Actinobacteria bacterium]
MNRLAGSASLYLRQHASDPVAWWPWCDEAFAEAAARDVPVLLSCGYSACHWCHVMQRESFADPGTSALIGDRFVAVKVDRGQRPDIDALYMDYVTATTGHGGWPMTVFLTPSRLPLLGGTYFPREPAGRLPAFGDVLAEVARAYAEDRGRLERTSADSLAFLREMAAPKRAGTIDARLVTGAADAVLQASDAAHGGFGEGAKFPRFSLLLFLTAFARLQGDREAAFVTRNALVTMLRGGIHDHVGGGIFRYTVDREWAVPHFEKMLCDNAMLLRTLATAHATEPSEEFALAAARTAAWLEREMRLGNGAFATALAAESGGIERLGQL